MLKISDQISLAGCSAGTEALHLIYDDNFSIVARHIDDDDRLFREIQSIVLGALPQTRASAFRSLAWPLTVLPTSVCEPGNR
jgi:hypothetical protein